MKDRLDITPEAEALVRELQAENGPLIFHLSGGCCDGSQPMCFAEGEFRLGSQDVRLGAVADTEMWMSKDQFKYWEYFHLTLDVVPGRGSSFSLEIPKGKRFLLRYKALEEVAE
ncbi:MAG: DUF779 domain-containing protein [Bacteroidota bacterium]